MQQQNLIQTYILYQQEIKAKQLNELSLKLKKKQKIK